MRKGLMALMGGLALAACGATPVEEWPGPPRPDAQGRVPVEAFDDYLGDHEEYAGSPEALVTEFLDLEHSDAAKRSIGVRQPAEGGERATVVALLDGLLDDSVRSVRYVLVTVRRGDAWRLESARAEVRCREGRGHPEFSAAPCV